MVVCAEAVGGAESVVSERQVVGDWRGRVWNLLVTGSRQMRSIVFLERRLGLPPNFLERSRTRRKRQLPAMMGGLTSSLSPWCV